MKLILAGMQMIQGNRRLWPFVWKPLIASLFAYLVILIGGWALIVPRLTDWLDQWIIGWVVTTLGTALYVLLWIFISGPIFVGVLGAFSGFLWERLAKEVELIQTGEVRSADPPQGMAIFDSIIRLVMALFLAVVLIFLGHACLGLVGIIVGGWLAMIEFSGPAFARQGSFLFHQSVRIWKAKSTFGFMLGAGVISLVPVLNALLFPCLVAGGTLLCLEAVQQERRVLDDPKPPIDSA